MSDRLAELRRQRALVQQHLAWLDAEVAALEKPAAGQPISQVLPTAAERPSPAPTTPFPAAGGTHETLSAAPRPRPLPATATSATAGSVDALLAEYRVEPTALKNDVRKGCFLYFAAALALLALVVAILYLTLSSR